MSFAIDEYSFALRFSVPPQQFSRHKMPAGAMSWAAVNIYSACFYDNLRSRHLMNISCILITQSWWLLTYCTLPPLCPNLDWVCCYAFVCLFVNSEMQKLVCLRNVRNSIHHHSVEASHCHFTPCESAGDQINHMLMKMKVDWQ